MPYTKEQKREYNRKYQQKIQSTPHLREAENARNRRNYKERMKWIASLKLPCVVCGEDEPCCIDFHHKDPTQKEYNIGTISHKFHNRDRIKTEIDKCVTLCANCHRKFHAGLIDLPCDS